MTFPGFIRFAQSAGVYPGNAESVNVLRHFEQAWIFRPVR
jgi:hypothetical protein